MKNNNELRALLDIDYPIIQAPMAGGPTTPELISEVSNYGGLGMVGAGYLHTDQLTEQIGKVKRLTSRAFGVNLFIIDPPEVSEEEIESSSEALQYFRNKLNLKETSNDVSYKGNDLDRKIDVIISESVPICSFTFGLPPREVITRLKQKGIRVIGTATTVEEAIAVQQAGMDAVVAQGSEAGGHRGSFSKPEDSSGIGTMALVPQVCDHVTIPVIASGGVMDARGIAASHVLGAQGVQMGSAFLTTDESGAHSEHKAAILKANDDDTVVTKAFSGKWARGIRNEFTDYMGKESASIAPYPIQNSLTKPIRTEAKKKENPQYMSLWAGQGLRLSQKVRVRELMDELVRGTEELIDWS